MILYLWYCMRDFFLDFSSKTRLQYYYQGDNVFEIVNQQQTFSAAWSWSQTKSDYRIKMGHQI